MNKIKARSFNRQNVGLQNRSSQFKSERACQFFSKAVMKYVISSPLTSQNYFRFRILDFGFEQIPNNPKTEIRNLKSSRGRGAMELARFITNE